ncbi:MAG: SWIB/MDM2 domain-containing protein [Candidatus Eiseniibacteriota bacterium]
MAKARAKSKGKAKGKPKMKAKRKAAKAKAKPKAKGKAKSKPKMKAKPKAAKAKPAPKPAAKPKPKAKRAANPAFMKPVQPDADLAAIVGPSAMPRTEVTKRIWAYIKANKLQDGRNINPDDKLAKLFGGRKTITMFEMTKHISKHVS